jgi:hypothetical protein
MRKASPSSTNRRYHELPDVEISETNVPEKLRPLIPFAMQWGIVGDEALERLVRKASPENIARTLAAAMPLKDAISDFAFYSAEAAAIPVPDEVVLFQIFHWSLCRLETERYLPAKAA